MREIKASDEIDVGETPAEMNDRLEQGVLLNRQSQAAADAKFREAVAFDPSAFATGFCVYGRQAGLSADWAGWVRKDLAKAASRPARFALYAWKAIAFIRLRHGEADKTRRRLEKIAGLGGIEGIGGGMAADLARAVA